MGAVSPHLCGCDVNGAGRTVHTYDFVDVSGDDERDKAALFYLEDKILVVLRDYSHNAFRTVELTTYAVEGEELARLHRTDYSNRGYRDGRPESRRDFEELICFLGSGYRRFSSTEVLSHDGDGFHVHGHDRQLYFHNSYGHLSDPDLKLFPSLLREARYEAINNGHTELVKHKLAIVLYKNEMEVEKEIASRPELYDQICNVSIPGVHPH
ncbi:hypothetical protein GF345_03470 [Candidatus Woesearchaeota archaeon]|nr:hypothetical protein [Candidatus Woesearchaeota archaeon]